MEISDQNDLMLPFVFDLDDSKLIMISKSIELNLLEDACRDCVVFAIDTERRPSYWKGKLYPTSTIQIATRSSDGDEKVLILDMLSLGQDKRCLQRLNIILKVIFEDEFCYKIGQGFKNDLIEIYQSYPVLSSCFDIEIRSVVDTEDLYRTLEDDVQQMISLKKLVRNYLHFNLLKTQQISDWSRRPLTSQQIHYAACDALVLLRLYDAMLCEIEDKYMREKNKIFDVHSIAKSLKLTKPAALSSPLGKRSADVVSSVPSTPCSSAAALASSRSAANPIDDEEHVVSFSPIKRAKTSSVCDVSQVEEIMNENKEEGLQLKRSFESCDTLSSLCSGDTITTDTTAPVSRIVSVVTVNGKDKKKNKRKKKQQQRLQQREQLEIEESLVDNWSGQTTTPIVPSWKDLPLNLWD